MVYEKIPIEVGRKFHPLYQTTNQGEMNTAHVSLQWQGR